jgi:hypothetical protein
MLALTPGSNKATVQMPAPAFSTTARRNALQRKCDCGQHTGGGQCEPCKKGLGTSWKSDRGTGARRTNGITETGPRVWSENRGQRGFAEMRVSGGSTTRESSEARKPASTKQSLEEEPQPKYSEHGVLITVQGSGTCVNGGAESTCDPTNGAYKIIRNSNTCCTTDCSRLHEQVHVSDVTNWGCCKALSAAYNKPGADKNAAVQKYNTWMDSARHITECHAYTGDVECAKTLARQKDCSGAGRNTDCCKDVNDYQARYAAMAETECAAAPRQVPACPTF